MEIALPANNYIKKDLLQSVILTHMLYIKYILYTLFLYSITFIIYYKYNIQNA